MATRVLIVTEDHDLSCILVGTKESLSLYHEEKHTQHICSALLSHRESMWTGAGAGQPRTRCPRGNALRQCELTALDTSAKPRRLTKRASRSDACKSSSDVHGSEESPPATAPRAPPARPRPRCARAHGDGHGSCFLLLFHLLYLHVSRLLNDHFNRCMISH